MKAVRLRICNLSKRFRSQGVDVIALDGINMEIQDEEFATILGPSGCGKSTLLRILAGLTPPSEGKALLHDQHIEGPGKDRGMVFQSYTLFPWLTVLKNIQFGPKLSGMPAQESERRARGFIQKVGLAGFEHAYPKSLSGGMKQRVAIARALANDPLIILADEPTGNLDSESGAEILNILVGLHKKGKTLIMVTHDKHIAEDAERIVEIFDGRIRRQ